MSVSSLQNKTIRPGRVVGYSYYYSNRRPLPRAKTARQSRRGLLRWGLLAVVVLGALIFSSILRNSNGPASGSTGSSAPAVSPKPTTTLNIPSSQTPANYCASNQLSQLVLVSISQRHLWACQGSKMVYDTPVVTGIDYLAADETPTGTYHIYDKQTDVTLTGSDSTGSWSDAVHYWMPFLRNQYGTYGLHDATWRDNSAFGNISPNSSDASHGCVELPLSAAQWLYSWTRAGTTVTIES